MSDFVASRFDRNNRILLGSKVKRIYNGLDLNRFCPVNDEPVRSAIKKSLLQAEENDVVITYTGQFIAEKGVKPYLQAVKELLSINENLCFVFVGQGPLYDEAIRTIPETSLSRTRFLGVRDDVENIFRVSDIVVVPSIWEEASGW